MDTHSTRRDRRLAGSTKGTQARVTFKGQYSPLSSSDNLDPLTPDTHPAFGMGYVVVLGLKACNPLLWLSLHPAIQQ